MSPLVQKSGGIGYVPIERSFRLVHPKAISRPLIPREVPKEFAMDYSEACLVLRDSEKASAALSRRCLQHLLGERPAVKPGNLVVEIPANHDGFKAIALSPRRRR
jgi:hypothetical protein